ncbi:uncharacterized protein MONBRDRAFT_30738 [Monosiga brevicollis MX1]|uniref:Neurotransmitter-gated ion-channel ligand-binding domain-containing protein n=1 Tax=Monosiga brevicollis TaxID=81824 RepID=A9UNW8_MONBE|nr:uncharacterized protein MONBRDRAFT_30738 [Monosiga brevicollis MX1]EDQ92771.1 predicted protein [Monosiga brevicollis MX1]|eukprot:XP_001742533.1 hypothetical protein [Monosiga brevicollis MX1]
MEVDPEWLDRFHPSTPKDVIIRYDIYNISSIDTVKQGINENSTIPWSTLWNPRLTIQNAVELRKFEITWRKSSSLSQHIDGLYDHNPSGRIWVTARVEVSGRFTIRMSLEHFPFDVQELYLLVRSKWRHNWVRFRRHPVPSYMSIVNLEYSASIDTEYFLDPLPQHKLEMPHDERHKASVRRWDGVAGGYVRSDKPLGKSFPLAPLCITVARKPSYYMWNIVFPVFWIVAVSGVSMAIEGDSETEVLDARLSVTLTLLLTLIAVKFVVASDLPNASYLTWLDAYILFGFFLLILVVAENVIAAHYADSRSWIDLIGVCVLGVIWVGVHVLAFFFLFPRRVWRHVGSTQLQRSTEIKSMYESTPL